MCGWISSFMMEYEEIDGWMDELIVCQMDEWMDEWIDGWMDGWMDEWMNG